MRRLWERTYPYILTIICTFLYHFCIPSDFKNILRGNIPNIAMSLISLAGIFLSFIGAILGVLVSIKNTKFESVLNENKATRDLINYIKECFFFSFVSFVVGVFLLMIYSSSELVDEKTTDIIIIVLLLMIFSAYRVILILFAFVERPSILGLHNNLWNKETFTPKKV